MSRVYTFVVYDRIMNPADRATVSVKANTIETAREKALTVGTEVLTDILNDFDANGIVAEFETVEVDAT